MYGRIGCSRRLGGRELREGVYAAEGECQMETEIEIERDVQCLQIAPVCFKETRRIGRAVRFYFLTALDVSALVGCT